MRLPSAMILAWMCSLACTVPAEADDEVIFSENFASLPAGWGEPDSSQSVSNNQLMLNIAPESIRHSLFEDQSFDNADIRLKIAEIKGDADQPGGIIFWATDTKNYYAALVQSDGGFLVARLINGRSLNPVGFQSKSAVQPGLGQTNALRVVTSGNRATIYANDQQVAAFKGYPPAAQSKIGIHAESGNDPSTWAFSELSVRKGPASADTQPTRDDSILFSDDFSSFDPGWGYADLLRSVVANKLVVNLQPNLAHHSVYQGRLFGDADIRIKISQVKGDTDEPGGLVFWAVNVKDYCVLMIQADGKLSVGRFHDGKWTINTLPVEDGIINKGPGQVNELGVVAHGKSAALYVNNAKIATYTGFPPDGGGMIGIYGESGDDPSTWEFSSLVVRNVP